MYQCFHLNKNPHIYVQSHADYLWLLLISFLHFCQSRSPIKSLWLSVFQENAQLFSIWFQHFQLFMHTSKCTRLSNCLYMSVDVNCVQHGSVLSCVIQILSFVPTDEKAKSIQRGRKAIWYESVITGNHCSCFPLMWEEFNYLPLPVLEKSLWWEMEVLLQ